MCHGKRHLFVSGSPSQQHRLTGAGSTVQCRADKTCTSRNGPQRSGHREGIAKPVRKQGALQVPVRTNHGSAQEDPRGTADQRGAGPLPIRPAADLWSSWASLQPGEAQKKNEREKDKPRIHKAAPQGRRAADTFWPARPELPSRRPDVVSKAPSGAPCQKQTSQQATSGSSEQHQPQTREAAGMWNLARPHISSAIAAEILSPHWAAMVMQRKAPCRSGTQPTTSRMRRVRGPAQPSTWLRPSSWAPETGRGWTAALRSQEDAMQRKECNCGDFSAPEQQGVLKHEKNFDFFSFFSWSTKTWPA